MTASTSSDDIEVTYEALPCEDLAERLAQVYRIALRRARELREREAAGQSLAGAPAASEGTLPD